MKKNLVKLYTILLVLLLSSAFAAINASAFSIGFDENGTGTFTDIDLITYQTDTALSIGFDPSLTIPVPDAPIPIDFWLQARVGTFGNGGSNVIFNDIALGKKELTFVTSFTEMVTSLGFNSEVPPKQVASFSGGPDPSSVFKYFIDDIDPGGGTLANPNLVSGYNDGLEILDATLVRLESSFEATTPGVLGTGSFDAVFKVVTADTNYFDLKVGDLLRWHSTGTINQPALFNPAVMWDGTSTAAGFNPQTFKVDGSSSFTVIPEPSTFVLLGLGLLGAGIITRKRK